MSKLTLLTAAAAGYVLGARAGRERYEQIAAGARTVARNPKVQSAAAGPGRRRRAGRRRRGRRRREGQGGRVAVRRRRQGRAAATAPAARTRPP